MALEQHIAYAKQHNVPMRQTFPELLIQLISTRPSVCAEAMDTYSDLRSLAIHVLRTEVYRYEGVKSDSTEQGCSPVVVLPVSEMPLSDREIQFLPISLLHSISVVLSIWNDENANGDRETTVSVDVLADILLRPNNDGDDIGGELHGAKSVDRGSATILVEYASRVNNRYVTCDVFVVANHFSCSFLFLSSKVDNAGEVPQ